MLTRDSRIKTVVVAMICRPFYCKDRQFLKNVA